MNTNEFGFTFPSIEEAAALAAAEAEAELQRRFTARRERQLAAEREARRQKLDRGELVIEAPSAGDPPETVAVVVNHLEAMPGVSRQARDSRKRAYDILLDGALAMSGSGLRLEGRPADAALAPKPAGESPAPRTAPREAEPRAKVTKAARKPQKAVTPRRVPKVRPAPKPRSERPAPPDEVRCTALNSKGLRCKMAAVADGRCLLHSTAG